MPKFGDVRTQAPTNGTRILTGSGAPAEVTGATGDMYLDTTGHVLYGPKTATATPTAGYTQPTSTFWAGIGGTGGAFQAGNQYNIVNPIRVISLRYNTPGDSLTSRQMGIWRHGTGQLLSPVVSTTAESGAGWKEVSLTTPVDLLAGDSIRIAATCNGNIYYSAPAPPMQTTDVTIVQGIGQTWGGGTIAYPSGNWGYYFPMDIGISRSGTMWSTRIKSV
jgi:hypothetical protein